MMKKLGLLVVILILIAMVAVVFVACDLDGSPNCDLCVCETDRNCANHANCVCELLPCSPVVGDCDCVGLGCEDVYCECEDVIVCYPQVDCEDCDCDGLGCEYDDCECEKYIPCCPPVVDCDDYDCDGLGCENADCECEPYDPIVENKVTDIVVTYDVLSDVLRLGDVIRIDVEIVGVGEFSNVVQWHWNWPNGRTVSSGYNYLYFRPMVIGAISLRAISFEDSSVYKEIVFDVKPMILTPPLNPVAQFIGAGGVAYSWEMSGEPFVRETGFSAFRGFEIRAVNACTGETDGHYMIYRIWPLNWGLPWFEKITSETSMRETFEPGARRMFAVRTVGDTENAITSEWVYSNIVEVLPPRITSISHLIVTDIQIERDMFVGHANVKLTVDINNKHQPVYLLIRALPIRYQPPANVVFTNSDSSVLAIENITSDPDEIWNMTSQLPWWVTIEPTEIITLSIQGAGVSYITMVCSSGIGATRTVRFEVVFV